ncbi:MAG: hypothetical protein ORN55_00080 [Chitinophagaceae bacterium]|nr:hypothetical protein [Chitinophagaceae bacterium]
MQYINPIEILGLSNSTDTTSIDNEIIKKAKKKLFADIDLSDNGLFEYYGHQLTKGDCEKVIEQLTNNNFKEFYLYLASNNKLNSFLVNGNDAVFINFKQESIFKLPEFINFISPYYAPKFDKAFLKAFENEDGEQTEAILKTSFLISQSDINIAFKGVSNNIQNKIAEIDEITKDIKNEESIYDEDDIEDIVDLVIEYFPTKTLNCLPQYFQSQILKIAKSINYLQLSIWDAFDNTQVPNDLLEHLLTLNIGGLDKPTFENNYKIVKKKNDERIEQAKNEPLLKKWAGVLLQLRKFIKEVEEESLSSNLAFEQTKNLFSISELNSLPDFADEIRTQIGYSIRSLSISIWNNHSDIKNSINTINLALQINVQNEDKAKFKQDLVELQELEKKYKGVLVCHFCDENSPNDNSIITKTIYKETYRSYIGRKVEFSYATISIPRCNSCKEIHSKGHSQFAKYFRGVLIVGMIIGVVTEGSHFIIGGFIGGVVGWIIGISLQNRTVQKQGIKDDSESTLKNHPILTERMKQGWTFSKPSA